MHEAPRRGLPARSGELCPAPPRTGAPGQGPVSQGFMERTPDAYSSSGVLLQGPRPALTTQDIWAMAVLFGDVPRGLSPNALPRHRPSHVGLRACYGVERSGIRATPCHGMVARLTAQGRDKRQPVSALSAGGGTPEQEGGGRWWDPRPGDRPPQPGSIGGLDLTPPKVQLGERVRGVTSQTAACSQLLLQLGLHTEPGIVQVSLSPDPISQSHRVLNEKFKL